MLYKLAKSRSHYYNDNMLIIPFFYKNKLFLKQPGLLAFFFFYLLQLSAIVYAESSYIKCWTNADGLKECGNTVPREYYSQRIQYIDDKGITRKVKEREKTKEERNSQKNLDELLALETEKKRQAKEYDEVLLKTYLSIDDLLASLNSKLDIIQSRSVVLDSTIELKKRDFGNLVRKAANIERSGKKISKRLTSKLDTARKNLRNMQAQVIAQELNTKRIKSVFARDVERFVLSKSKRIKYSLSTPRQLKKMHVAYLDCLNQSQCDSFWEKGNKFIEEFATTDMLYSTSKVSVTDIPKKMQDIAMSLSIQGNQANTRKLIILQIRCNPEREGQEFCSGNEVNGILKEFKSIIY